MKSIIATLIISALILSLMIMGIELWRNNMEIVRITALKVNQTEKVKKLDILPIDKEELTGGDVISVIRYFSNDEEVEVVVSVEGAEKRYLIETYQQNQFYIPYEMKFEKNTFYEGNKIKKVFFYSK